jgi:hypothetical protein
MRVLRARTHARTRARTRAQRSDPACGCGPVRPLVLDSVLPAIYM